MRLEFLGVVAANPRDVFKEALVAGLIHDGNAWSEAQRMRNLSSHTYDEKLAEQVYEFVKNKGDILFQDLAREVNAWKKDSQ